MSLRDGDASKMIGWRICESNPVTPAGHQTAILHQVFVEALTARVPAGLHYRKKSKLSNMGVNLKSLVLQVSVLFIFTALLLLGAAGTVLWPEGWAFLLPFFAFVRILSAWLARYDPELLHERLAGHRAVEQPWDRALLGLAGFLFAAHAQGLQGHLWTYGTYIPDVGGPRVRMEMKPRRAIERIVDLKETICRSLL